MGTIVGNRQLPAGRNDVMTHADYNLPSVYLKPGEMCLRGEPAVVTTLLGSCVAVTMFCGRLRIGAICHGLLPTCKGKGHCLCADGFRYVECSIRRMAGRFREMGANSAEIEVKMFGGADMFTPLEDGRKGITVGRQNIDTALRIIEEEGLRLAGSDFGGERGRKIFFNTHTGEVLLKRLNVSRDAGLSGGDRNGELTA